jgi:hypothetical protein
MSMKEHT